MVCIITNSPARDVWKMTLGQVMRYAVCVENVLPMINPLAGMGKKDKPITNPRAIMAVAKALGVGRRDDGEDR